LLGAVNRSDLSRHGAEFAPDGSSSCVESLKEKAVESGDDLSDEDAHIAASAIEEGTTLLTRDTDLYDFMTNAGYSVELLVP
jgi:predicted nucleic acid-binding protein